MLDHKLDCDSSRVADTADIWHVKLRVGVAVVVVSIGVQRLRFVPPW